MGYLQKLGLCLLTGVTAVIVLQRISYRLCWEWGGHHYPRPIFVIIGGAPVLLGAVVSSVIWQRKGASGSLTAGSLTADSLTAGSVAEPVAGSLVPGFPASGSPASGSLKAGSLTAGSVAGPTALCQGLLAGFIGLDLAMFGWQKLFHQQFIVPLGRLDEPFSSFSREDLTWAYFHASYAFTCVIAFCQIAGSFLLFPRRTRLFGAIFLLPVLLNITLIDLFYGFEAGVTVHAIILLIGLLYLILVHYRRLAVFFFPPGIGARDRAAGGYMLPVGAAVVLPLLLVWSFGSPDLNPQLTGKYTVQNLRVDGVEVAAGSCRDSVLTTVIFDLNNEVVLEFNSLGRRWIGSYRLDRATGVLMASWRFPASARDTLLAKLSPAQAGAWLITGSLGKASLQALLVKSGLPAAGQQR
jgi:hypothetical protein